ncbi:hypothetical protein K438DRAFT_1991971 [Mycena galopus ATCC 62051]|nr:hypothetical protein K438DRAFT_1991971 [Mycena galopus ATCC 62051]
MPISLEDIYPDALRASTPPASRSSSPPARKRQRLTEASQIPKRVLRLLDIEADEDDPQEDDEDEEESGSADFIDDEPNHRYSAFPLVPSPDPGPESRDAELLAAYYDERARDEHERELEEAEAKRDCGQAGANVIPQFPPFPTRPLDGFCVAPYCELRLVDFMTTMKGVALVGTQGPGSRLVFYETQEAPEHGEENDGDGAPEGDDAKKPAEAHIPIAHTVARQVQAWLRKEHVWFRGPEEIPLAECSALLGLPRANLDSMDTRYNRFGRLKSRIFNGIYYDDLVFIAPRQEDQIWVVPRVHVDVSPLPPEQRPPRRLWDTNALKEHIPLNKLDFMNRGERCVWGRRVFAPNCGLEILPLSSKHTVVGVHPTDDELEPFFASKCPEIAAAFKGVICALQEGDRVVSISRHGWDVQDAGEIVAFFERREAKQCLRMAVCLLPLRMNQAERTAAFDGSLRMMRTKMIGDAEVPKRAEVFRVSELRLHVLSPRHRVNAGDRVVVVAGSTHRGFGGRISEFIDEETIRFDALEPEAAAGLEVALRHVRRDFRRGDIVRAVRGEYQGQIGLIIALYLGGEIEVYICDDVQTGNFVDSETGELKVTNDEWRGQDVDATEVKVIKLRTHDVVFVPFQHRPDPIGRTRQETGAPWDRARAEWERDIMNTGRLVTGMFVRIRWGPKKAQFGVVTGYRYTKPTIAENLVQRRTSTRKELTEDIRIQVVVEHSQTTLDLPIDKVVERFSGLPLLVAVLLHRYRKLYDFEKRAERPPTPPLPAMEVGNLTEAELTKVVPVPTTSVPDIGETTGLWLTHKNLARKCIDVQVVSPDSLVRLRKEPNIGNRVGVKVMKVAGYNGYVRPFDRAVTEAKAYSSVLEFLSLGRDALVPMVALRPLRTTPVNGQHGEMCCISARRCRVIIIGPDVQGSRSRIGEYAETVPESTPGAGIQIVRVRFAWERLENGSDYQAHAQYQLPCLCSALNRETPTKPGQPPLPPTDFDKKRG